MPRKKKSAPVTQNPARLVSRAGLVTVEAIGLAIAVYLTLISLRLIYDGEVPCPRSRLFACESVVRGMFSSIGPFSIAVLGSVYFAVQLCLTGLLSRGRWAAVLKVLAVLSGLLFVAWLRSLELVYLKKICPWCWGVALTVLAQTVLVWPLAVPVFPALKLPGRVAASLTLLFAFLGLTSSVELLFKPSSGGTTRFFGWTPKETAAAPSEEEKEEGDAEAKEKPDGADRKVPASLEKVSGDKPPKPEKTPRTVAQSTQAPKTETAEPLARPRDTMPTPPPGDSFYSYTPTPAPPAPAPAPTPAADEPEPPIDLPDVPELQIMVQRGWRMVATTERVEELIRTRGPVLLMVYDPFCEECHATMRGMNTDEVQNLPVTRVAIDQSSLIGTISSYATHVPTLLLFSRDGQLLWKHEARIKSKKLVDEVTSRLQ